MRKKNKTPAGPGLVKVRCGLKTYLIPVDAEGMVPREAIIERYQLIGSRDDLRSDDCMILPDRCTPEQIKRWWVDPESCDISGIDTRNPAIYSVPSDIKGKKRTALSKIAIVADRREADRIRHILAESFTAEELEHMSCNGSLIISTTQYSEGCTGYYLCKQDGVLVPRIIYETGTSADGIVHEAVHHLRAVEGRSRATSPGMISGPMYNTAPRRAKKKLIQEEEAMTVVETLVRTPEDITQSGYYDNVPDKTPREAYLEDRQILTGGKRYKGSAARKAIEQNYSRTNIARSLIADYERRSKR